MKDWMADQWEQMDGDSGDMWQSHMSDQVLFANTQASQCARLCAEAVYWFTNASPRTTQAQFDSWWALADEQASEHRRWVRVAAELVQVMKAPCRHCDRTCDCEGPTTRCATEIEHEVAGTCS